MNQLLEATTTESKLKEIFINRLGFDFDKLQEQDPDILNKNLLGKEFQLASRDLLYIFFDVEKEFSIKVSQSNILSGFNTFNKILSCINQSKPDV